MKSKVVLAIYYCYVVLLIISHILFYCLPITDYNQSNLLILLFYFVMFLIYLFLFVKAQTFLLNNVKKNKKYLILIILNFIISGLFMAIIYIIIILSVFTIE